MHHKVSGYAIAIGIIISLIVMLIFMLLFIEPESPGKLHYSNKTAETTVKEPVFRQDGELKFLKDKTGEVIFVARIEVAQTPEARELGLMYRKSMPQSAGMLFVFDESEPLTFWMKNTIIPLDIIFADSAKKIVGIVKNTVPYSENPIRSGKAARFVVEMNAGFTKNHHLVEGDHIEFRY